MKNKKLLAFLAAEAVVCVVLAVLSVGIGSAEIALSAGAFPFAQLAAGLRVLSLSGAPGNVVALIVYFAVCLSPLAYFIARLIGGRQRLEDILLPVMCISMFVVIYLMINPGKGEDFFHAGPMTNIMGPVFLSGILYSTLTGYFVLRAVRAFSAGSAEKLTKYMKLLMALACAVYVFNIFCIQLAVYISSLRYNTRIGISGDLLGQLALFLQFLQLCLPPAIQLLVLMRGFGLIAAFESEPFSEESVAQARSLGALCRVSLITVVVYQFALNLFQGLMSAGLRSVNFAVSIPIDSVMFLLVIFLLAGYLERGRRLREDSELII